MLLPRYVLLVFVLLVLDANLLCGQSAKLADPYALHFEDFEWQAPEGLQPLEGARPLSSDKMPIRDAIALYESKSAALPGDFAFRTILGQLLLQQAQEDDDLPSYGRSIEVLREALVNNPNYAPAQLALANSLMAQHDFDEALMLATRCLESDPQRPAILAAVFDSLVELGQYEAASQRLAQLIELEQSASVLARAARMAELKGELKQAVALIDRALQDLERRGANPNDAVWYLWRKGKLLLDSGQLDSAEQTLRQGLELDGEDEASLVTLAEIVFAKGDRKAASEILEVAAKSKAPPVLALLGDLLYLQGDAVRAGKLWDETEAIMRAEAKVAKVAHAREVAMFFANHDRHLAEAIELSSIDMQQRSDAFAHDARAWVLLKNQRIEEADRSIQLALESVCCNCELHFHAACISAAAGRPQQARQHLQKIADLNPHFSPIAYTAELERLRVNLEEKATR